MRLELHTCRENAGGSGGSLMLLGRAQLILIVSSDGKGTTFIVQNSATGGARGATYANATRRQNFELHTYSYKYFLLPSFTY